MATTNDIKNGTVLNIDGQLWTVIEFQHVKPGKGGAFVRTKLKNVLSGKVVDRTFNAGAKIETANVDRRDFSTCTRTARTSSSWTRPTTTRSTSRRRRSATPRTSCSRTRAYDRHARRRPALRRAAGVGRPRDHLHRAGPAGRPLVGRHQARHARDGLRDPGPAVPRAGHEGQGGHPRRKLPRPRELTQRRCSGRPQQGAQARPRHPLRRRRPRRPIAATLAEEAPRAAEPQPSLWQYARDIVEGVDDT